MTSFRTACSAVVAAGVLLASCGDDPAPVRIIGECRLETGAVSIIDSAETGVAPGVFSVGRLGDHTLVGWQELEGEDMRGLRVLSLWARWVDADLRADGLPVSLGRSHNGYRPRWVRGDGRLHAQVFATTEETADLPAVAPEITLWSLAPPPGGGTDERRITLDVHRSDITGSAALGIGGILSPGLHAQLPAAWSDGVLWTAVVGSPDSCPDGRATLTEDRLHVLRTEGPDTEVFVMQDDDDPCPDPAGESAYRQTHGNPWLTRLSNGDIGLLFRTGGLGTGIADGRLRWTRIRPDGSFTRSRSVGATHDHTSIATYQQQAVALPGGRVLFTERRGSTDECQALRIMNEDGTEARNAPWQLPCIEDDRLRTVAAHLVAVPGGAVVVWDEKVDTETGYVTTLDTDFHEGVYAAVLTPQGQRGSEVVQVTDDAATTLTDRPRTEELGPVPGSFAPVVASDGSGLTVMFTDIRTGAPVIYGRRMTCETSE